MQNKDLSAECVYRWLAKSGNKEALVSRLLNYLATRGSAAGGGAAGGSGSGSGSSQDVAVESKAAPASSSSRKRKRAVVDDDDDWQGGGGGDDDDGDDEYEAAAGGGKEPKAKRAKKQPEEKRLRRYRRSVCYPRAVVACSLRSVLGLHGFELCWLLDGVEASRATTLLPIQVLWLFRWCVVPSPRTCAGECSAP